MTPLLNQIVDFDRRRPSFPGEHFIVAAVGVSLLLATTRRRGLAALVTLLIAGALLARAASGRDGLARLSQST